MFRVQDTKELLKGSAIVMAALTSGDGTPQTRAYACYITLNIKSYVDALKRFKAVEETANKNNRSKIFIGMSNETIAKLEAEASTAKAPLLDKSLHCIEFPVLRLEDLIYFLNFEKEDICKVNGSSDIEACKRRVEDGLTAYVANYVGQVIRSN